MPAHAVPTLQQDGSVVRGECWCRPWVQIVVAVNDEGEVYRFPNHIHGADLGVLIAYGTGDPPS